MEKEAAFVKGFEKRAIMAGAMRAVRAPANKARTYVGMGLMAAGLPVAAAAKGFDKLVDPHGKGDPKMEW